MPRKGPWQALGRVASLDHHTIAPLSLRRLTASHRAPQGQGGGQGRGGVAVVDPSRRGWGVGGLLAGSVTRPPELEICQWGLFEGVGFGGVWILEVLLGALIFS